jgi:serine/threonine protein kinase
MLPHFGHGFFGGGGGGGAPNSFYPFDGPNAWNDIPPRLPSNFSNTGDTHPEFETIKRLGAGRNGGQNKGVYIVKYKADGENYIEKRVPLEMVVSGQAQREVRAMRQLSNHRNIICILLEDLECYTRLGYGSIYMQHCELGSLDGLIDRFRRNKERLEDEGFLYAVLWDVAHALCYMATGVDIKTAYRLAKEGRMIPKETGWNTMLHRDLKPGNIFITRRNMRAGQNFPNLVVGDFGLNVSQTEIDNNTAKPPGDVASGFTPMFAPPEAPRYDVRSDIYSLGVTVHCLAIMRNTPRSVIGHRDIHPLDGRFEDGSLKKVVRRCLKHDPAERPEQYYLPKDVYVAYTAWKKKRNGDKGKKLPYWAFG